MSLDAGSNIAHYEILALLGKGGMGEVYRARDTKLKRDVALKIVPDHLSSDAERLVRFQREAELLASLNHPNIASIYGFEEGQAKPALVLELVQGETLAARIRQGALPVAEALDIAKQIAQALDAAHERGVIHRDLKPANVMITPEGRIKVLDFGLATILNAAPTSADFSNSPTIFSVSGNGVLLGTAAYMSPEQARGKATDRRTDVWAFGCVLFEMMTGKQLFGGETVSDSIAKVLEREPNWNDVHGLPTGIQRLLRRCLQKNPAKRIRDIGDMLVDLDDIDIHEEALAPGRAATGRQWMIVAVLAIVVISVLGGTFWRSRPEPAEAMYLSVVAPSGSRFVDGAAAGAPAVSPDGRFVAFVALEGESRKLWVRSLYSADAQLIPESEDAASPFWSPDGRWIGFFTPGKLLRAETRGGKPQVIASLQTDTLGRTSGTWNQEGTILFGLDTGRPLLRVSAEGGAVAAVTTLDGTPGHGHFRPHFLPGGRRFLFLHASPNGKAGGVFAGSLDSSETKKILPIETTAFYAPSGQLVFVREGTLFAQDFDLDRLEVLGEAIRIADSVNFGAGNASFSAFSVSETGILAYRTGNTSNLRPSRLAWFDRKGSLVETVGEIGFHRNPRLSPDGKRVSVQVADENATPTLWILGPGATSSRFGFGGFPVWSSDGLALLYAMRQPKPRILRKLVNGETEEQLLADHPFGHIDDVSPDGKYVAGSEVSGETNRDVIAVQPGSDQPPIAVAATAANELYGRFSPDGRWIAYQSDETGRYEIYLQAFPRASSKILISRNGGGWPVWRRDGKELFYIMGRQKLMSVTISASGSLQAGTPQPLFDVNLPDYGGIGAPSHFDVAPDGNRFLFNIDAAAATEVSPIHLIFNWTELLKR